MIDRVPQRSGAPPIIALPEGRQRRSVSGRRSPLGLGDAGVGGPDRRDDGCLARARPSSYLAARSRARRGESLQWPENDREGTGMQAFEKLGAFYLGKRYETGSGVTDDLVMYDSKDLTTHAVCVGMTVASAGRSTPGTRP